MACTDGGRHNRNVLMQWHLDDDGRPQEDPVHPGRTDLLRAINARAGGRGIAYAEMRCRRCGRNPRMSEERLGRLIAGLLGQTSDERVLIDVSSPPYAGLFGG